MGGRALQRLLPLGPALVLAVLGGLLVLQDRSLWYDELFTAQVGGVGPSALVRAVLTGRGTASYLAEVPPSYNAPYYVVVQAWLAVTGLPADGFGLRLLSLVPAVAGTAVLTAAVVRLAGRRVGLTAGLLAATSPLLVEYAAEGRGYGLAVLATATAVLGLVRWLEDGRLRLWALGATTAGLAHWFAVPVVAGLVLAALVLRRRAALPVLGVAALGVLPTLGLVALTQVNGIGDRAVGEIGPRGAEVPLLALQAWTGPFPLLQCAVVLACAAGLLVRDRTAVVAACWTAVPVLAVTAAELVRPSFVPRYLLPALLGLAVLSAAGLARLPRRWSVPLVVALLGLQLASVAEVGGRGPREPAREAVAALQERQVAGEPVVAADRRAALALQSYAGRLRPDVLVPPDDPPPGEEVVWLLRQSKRFLVRPSDDDLVLRARGLRVRSRTWFDGRNSDFVVQRWAR